MQKSLHLLSPFVLPCMWQEKGSDRFYAWLDALAHRKKWFYPALTGSNTPTSRLRERSEEDRWEITARKSPIGSTNHQWWMKKTPTDGSFTLFRFFNLDVYRIERSFYVKSIYYLFSCRLS